MGRVRRVSLRAALAGLAVVAASAALADRAAAFDGFGGATAESDYGDEIRFEVELRGGAPEHLELLLRFGDDPATFVAPVEPTPDAASYAWDAEESHVVPNTPIAYVWRARGSDGEVEAVSDEATFVYEDDRAGLDWQSADLGDATVHWYGDAEGRARSLGESAAGAARAAEALLGSRLAAPIDIFVYRTRDQFFGALGPGAREWTGAAAFPELRTVFLYLEGGSDSYLSRVVVHEVSHVVFHDATDNPYHEPAHWLNEGIATWSEEAGPGQQRPVVEIEARTGGLFAFEALTDRFPIGERGSALAYAQGAVMVDRIVDEHGPQALASLAAAYRDGATDAEALEAATGEPAEGLYDEFYDAFGADSPERITPDPIPPSDVGVPGDPAPEPTASGAPAARPGSAPDERPAGRDGAAGWLPLLPVLALAGLAVAAAIVIRRRAASRDA